MRTPATSRPSSSPTPRGWPSASGPGSLAQRIQDLRTRPEVDGVVVDLATDTRVQQLRTQADAATNRGCPFAQNLVAQEIKSVVDSYRATAADPDATETLRYVTILGGDTVVPFFRYPDQSLLGQESGYFPPTKSDSISEASLRRDYVLSQDAYGAGTTIDIRTTAFPIPDLAVGRLVETPAEITGMINAYIATNGVVSPGSSLVTGYDFLTDAADAVSDQFDAGMITPVDELITNADVSPQQLHQPGMTDPRAWSWNADDLRDSLLGERHDLVFLAGHFSANSALAADYQTQMITTELAASPVNLVNSIVIGAGCHTGYNLLDTEALGGVALPLDWAQAFAQKGAVLVAGTGYQYGDTDFLEYSERLYRDLAHELRAGVAGTAIPIGEALATAKRTYITGTPDIRGIHEKAVLEATLFGLPMFGVNLPTGRTGTPGGGAGSITPTAVGGTGPAAQLGLATKDLSVATPLTSPPPRALDVIESAGVTGSVNATWLEGPDGVVTNPARAGAPEGHRRRHRDERQSRPARCRLPWRHLYRYAERPAAHRCTDDGAARRPRAVRVARLLPDADVDVQLLRRVRLGWDEPDRHAGPASVRSRKRSAKHPSRLQQPKPASLLRRCPDAPRRRPRRRRTRRCTDDRRRSRHPGWHRHRVQCARRGRSLGSHPRGLGRLHEWRRHLGATRPPAVHGTAAGVLRRARRLARLDRTFAAAPASVQYVVQAANGTGLVSFDDNRGQYYLGSTTPAPAATATSMTLVAPIPTSGTFGQSVNVTAQLKAGASPVAGKPVFIQIGGAAAIGVTGADGKVTLPIALNSTPGATSITASFGGDATHKTSFAEAGFTIAKAATALATIKPYVTVDDEQRVSLTVLTATLGSKTQPLQNRTVTVTVTGPVTKTLSLITDYLGQVRLPLDLQAGTYTIGVTFAGDETYLRLEDRDQCGRALRLPLARRQRPDRQHREGRQHGAESSRSAATGGLASSWGLHSRSSTTAIPACRRTKSRRSRQRTAASASLAGSTSTTGRRRRAPPAATGSSSGLPTAAHTSPSSSFADANPGGGHSAAKISFQSSFMLTTVQPR